MAEDKPSAAGPIPVVVVAKVDRDPQRPINADEEVQTERRAVGIVMSVSFWFEPVHDEHFANPRG